MNKLKDIYEKDDFTEKDYQAFEKKLFSPLTAVSDLEKICMTLVHLPTKKAQDLLAAFKESDNAHKVGWLDCAIDEGQDVYMSPLNDLEEKEYLMLKMLQESEDELVDLEIKFNDAKLEVRRMEIEHEAIKDLVKKGELTKDEELGLHDVKLFFKSKVEELSEKIEFKEKISGQIKESIKTERYKHADPMIMAETPPKPLPTNRNRLNHTGNGH